MFAQLRYSELLLWVRLVGTLPKSKFLDPSQGSNLPAGFSDDNILRSAILTFLFTDFDRDFIDSVDQFGLIQFEGDVILTILSISVDEHGMSLPLFRSHFPNDFFSDKRCI